MISVVIPAYNEEEAIGEVIEEINKTLKENNIYEGSEIIVVNDGSTDKTKEKALEKGVIVLDNPQNTGYGYSLKKGISYAKNETIVITDADLSYPFSSVIEMLKEKNKGIDLVIGARTGQYYEESFIKSKLRKVLKKIVEFVAGKPIKDINSGLRIFDKSTVTKFFPRLCNTFSFTTTQTLSYVMNDLSVSYVDINYRKRCGKTKVKLLKDSIKCLKHIFKVGIYYNPFKIYFLLSTTLVFLSIVCIIIYILFFN